MGLERNIVVHVAVAGAGCHRPARRARGTAGAEVAAALIVRAEAAAASAAASVQHGQARIEALQHYFRGILLDAGLVGPFAGLQLTFDVNLGALLQILLGDLAQTFAEDHHPMPFGLFLALAGRLVAPGIRCRDPQIGDRPPVLSALDFRIGPEIADQNDLVHASRHRRSPLLEFTVNYWPQDHLEPTLYAHRSGEPGDPRVIHI